MLKIAFAQINSTVGDLFNNSKKMRTFALEAKEKYQADLIVFPELAISGYSPEDLLLKNDFINHCYNALLAYAEATPSICSLVGVPLRDNGTLKNAAVFIQHGKIHTIYYKQELPNYGVFDEKRYFTPGDKPCVIHLKGKSLGIAICEDIWTDKVVAQLKNVNVDIILSLNASPFEINKHKKRMNILQARAQESTLPILYVNCVGGQDDLIFDGDSMLIDSQGKTLMQLPCFEEGLGCFELNQLLCYPCKDGGPVLEKTCKLDANLYNALKLGIQDYVRKNGFKQVIVGSSGGIDSAVTLAIATDALGPENVSSVMMPSKYTAQMSLDDAEALAKNLQIKYQTIPITPCFDTFLATLYDVFQQLPVDKTEENLQARCRGTLLMALSNKLGALVLITGNRSEMAVGYATLYGDMAGGFAVLKDVYKTDVYKLAEYINREQEIIPNNILVRPPSAELREDQKDEDSLPPYSILDRILALYLDEELSMEDIAQQGFDKALVQEIIRLIHLNEYKRQQAPPGVRIHQRAFGRDRRYPITQQYKG